MKSTKILAPALAALMVFSVVGCKNSADQKNAAARADQYEDATAEVPVPNTDNFLTRKQVAEYMRRMDKPSKIFYTYIQGVNGNSYQYIVGTRPISLCALMTPPDRVEDRTGDPDVVRSAPTLDGVFYGGDGSGICNIYYAFDANSGALVMFKTQNMTVSDQPLTLEENAIRLSVKTDAEKVELNDDLKKDLDIQ